jgi:hypothetical protein
MVHTFFENKNLSKLVTFCVYFMSKSVLIKSVLIVCTILCTLTPKVRRVCSNRNDVQNKFLLVHTVHTVHTFCIFCVHLL